MANPAAVSSSKDNNSGTGSVVVTKDTSTADGDWLFAFLHGDESNSTVAVFDAPIGWTPVTSVLKGGATAGASCQLFVKQASSEGASWTFTRATGGSGNWGAIVIRVTGADPTVAINAFKGDATTVYASGDEGTTPAVTSTVDECLILRFSTWNESKSLTNIPAGTNEIWGILPDTVAWNDLSSNDGYVVQEDQATAGVSSAKVFNLSSGTQTANIAVAVQPPQGGGTEEADVSPVTSSFSVPSVTATFAAVATATVMAVTSSFTVPAVAATHQARADVDQLAAVLTVQPVSASHHSAASVEVVTSSLAVPSVTASGSQVEVASVDAVLTNFAVSEVDATYQSTAEPPPVTAELAVQAVAPQYIQTETADVDELNALFQAQAVTAESVAEFMAGAQAVNASFTVQAVDATHRSTAVLESVQIGATVQAVTAAHHSTAEVATLSASLVLPTVAAGSDSSAVASVEPVGSTFSLPSVDAAHHSESAVSAVSTAFNVHPVEAVYAEVDTAAVVPVVSSFNLGAVAAEAQEVRTTTPEPANVAVNLPAVSAEYHATAVVSPVSANLTVRMVTVQASVVTAEVEALSALFALPAVGAQATTVPFDKSVTVLRNTRATRTIGNRDNAPLPLNSNDQTVILRARK